MKVELKALKESNAKDTVRRLIKAMSRFASARGKRQQVLLLIGDPGTGKTSIIRTFSSILDLGILVIEAPHIIPEQLVRIPYYTVRKGKTEEEKAIEVEYAPAYIWKELKNLASKVSPNITKETLLKNANRFGGRWVDIAQNIIMPVLEASDFRKTIKVLLFIDEFYRTTNERILVTLRNIAFNRKIGDKALPPEVFVVLASNISDLGVVEIPRNNTFQTINFAYSPEETKDFLTTTLGLNKELVDKVFEAIKNPDGSLNLGRDDETNTYYERRRLTNLLRIVSEAKSPEEKRLAATILENHFRDPVDLGDEHRVAASVKKAIQPFLEGSTPYSQKEWFKAAKEYIKLVHKISKDHPYENVLVIPSEPGIGKTTMIRKVAAELGSRLAEIDVSTLTVDSATGVITVSDAGNVEFSNPELYDYIKSQLKFTDEDFKPENITPGKPRFIVFLDELNRPIDERILNVIRLLLKEKRVGEDEKTKLPPDTVIVSALNPSDAQTVELSMHIKDVLDAIPAMPSANALKEYLYREYEHKGMVDAFLEILERASAEYDNKGRKLSKDELIFWLGSPDDPRWMPPREIDNILGSVHSGITMIIKPKLKDYPIDKQKEAALKLAYEEIIPDMIDDISSTLVVNDPRPDNPVKVEVEQILMNIVQDTSLVEKLLSPVISGVRLNPVYRFEDAVDNENYTVDKATLLPWLQDITMEKAGTEIISKIEEILRNLEWPEAGRVIAKFTVNFNEAAKEVAKNIEEAGIECKEDPNVLIEKCLIQIDQTVAENYYKIACKLNEADIDKLEEIKQLEKDPVVQEYKKLMDTVRIGSDYLTSMRTTVYECAESEKAYKGCTLNKTAVLILLLPLENSQNVINYVKKGGKLWV